AAERAGADSYKQAEAEQEGDEGDDGEDQAQSPSALEQQREEHARGGDERASEKPPRRAQKQDLDRQQLGRAAAEKDEGGDGERAAVEDEKRLGQGAHSLAIVARVCRVAGHF